MSTPDSQNTLANDGDCQCEPQRALERLGNMRTLYANVVARFLDDSAGNFSKLRQAAVAGDLATVHQTAHSLKGLAAMCGAVGVEAILSELEAAGAARDATHVAALYDRLDHAMSETQNTLAPYRHADEPRAI